MSSDKILFIIDIVGIVAFALSAAIMAIKKGLDLFGVNIIAILTCVGGGCIRDLMLGSTPPLMLKRPIYIVISFICATLVFFVMYFHLGNENSNNKKAIEFYDTVIFVFDTLGLASFTIDGMLTTYSALENPSMLIVVFMGVLTGVGGGILRDITLQQLPFVFVKHIYALASMAGAIVAAVLFKYFKTTTGIICGFTVIVIIRLLAAKFKWNLPIVKLNKIKQ